MNAPRRIKVLIVENNKAVRSSFAELLNSDSRLQIVGMAKNEREASHVMTHRRPDVVLIDSDLPDMLGLEITRQIMETHPAPIVVCSGGAPGEAEAAGRILEAGAVASVLMPPDRTHPLFSDSASNLLQTLRLMSEVKVVHRWPRTKRLGNEEPVAAASSSPTIDVIGIGASTGGPPVLQTILDGLPADFPIPLLIVQHISRGFVQGLVDWLGKTSAMRVQIASHGQLPQPGNAYVAPDDHHMEVACDGTIALVDDKPDHGLRPSVSRLFRSLAKVRGGSAVGVLLTGMGKDGASELKRMRDRGAVTIAQDRKTSAVHGMPGEAIAIGGATNILPAQRIAPALLTLAQKSFLMEGASP